MAAVDVDKLLSLDQIELEKFKTQIINNGICKLSIQKDLNIIRQCYVMNNFFNSCNEWKNSYLFSKHDKIGYIKNEKDGNEKFTFLTGNYCDYETRLIPKEFLYRFRTDKIDYKKNDKIIKNIIKIIYKYIIKNTINAQKRLNNLSLFRSNIYYKLIVHNWCQANYVKPTHIPKEIIDIILLFYYNHNNQESNDYDYGVINCSDQIQQHEDVNIFCKVSLSLATNLEIYNKTKKQWINDIDAVYIIMGGLANKISNNRIPIGKYKITEKKQYILFYNVIGNSDIHKNIKLCLNQEISLSKQDNIIKQYVNKFDNGLIQITIKELNGNRNSHTVDLKSTIKSIKQSIYSYDYGMQQMRFLYAYKKKPDAKTPSILVILHEDCVLGDLFGQYNIQNGQGTIHLIMPLLRSG